LGLALDEPRGDDERFEKGGLTFVVGREMTTWVGPDEAIHVDFDPRYRFLEVHTRRSSTC